MSYTWVKKKVVRREVTINEPKDGTGFDQRKVFVTMEILAGEKKSFDIPFFTQVVSNLEGVADETGKEIPFSKEFLAAFLEVDYHLAAFQREYINCTIAAGRGN